jgi:hypothetical protein
MPHKSSDAAYGNRSSKKFGEIRVSHRFVAQWCEIAKTNVAMSEGIHNWTSDKQE